MTSISPVSTARTSVQTTSTTATTGTARAAAQPAAQTGFAARVAQLGPLAGTIVATSDLVDTAVDATYTIATKKLQQFGDAVENVAEKASNTLQSLEHAIEDGAATASTSVKNAAQSLAKTFEDGVHSVGQWFDETA